MSKFHFKIEIWRDFLFPVSVHDDEAVVPPFHDEVGVQRDAEVLVVHLKVDNYKVVKYKVDIKYRVTHHVRQNLSLTLSRQM